MIICPIITYDSVVRWTRVKVDSAEKVLTKLQRIVGIVMIGCIRTMPTVSRVSPWLIFTLYVH